MERKGRSVLGNYYKGHMDKTKGGVIREERWGWLGLGGSVGGKCRQLYLNNNKKTIMTLKNTMVN